MMHHPGPECLTLPRNASASALARRFLERAQCPEHHAAVLEEAQLLVSEVVTNAVQHGGPPVTLAVSCAGSNAMEVRVADGSPQPLEPREAGPLDEGGRGLELVDFLSSQWGVESADDGKVVWFLLRASGNGKP